MRSRPRICLALLAVLALVCDSGWAESAAPPTDEGPVQRIAREGNAATVGIYCNRGAGDAYYGTGAVITPTGYILTSTTVVMADAREIEVYFTDYTKADASLVEVNTQMETSLIKVEREKLPFFPVARKMPPVGDAAFTFGNAKNMIRLAGNATFSAGIISGAYQVKSADGQSSYAGLALETDAAINPGQDGGPLVNSRGELAGIISLSYTDLRWQGTAVPLPLILKSLKSFQNGTVKLSDPSSKPVGQRGWCSPAVHKASEALVALEVTRKDPPEILPRCSWTELLKQTDNLHPAQKARRLQAFSQTEMILSANRQIRRPDHVVTGVLVSADGKILTSIFNIADEVVFRHKEHGRVKPEYKGELKDLFPYPQKEYKPSPNKMTAVTAILKDGRRLPAKIVARHMPLGIALLKIEADKLPFLDVKARAKVPVPGSAAGVLGYIGGEYPYTLNTGMVSSTERQRSLRFQFDAILNYGNSGGPVIAPDGSFYGIALQPLSPGTTAGRVLALEELRRWRIAINSGVSLGARADEVAKALPALVQGKSTDAYEGPYLGVSPDPRKILSENVVIAIVAKKSPAEKAGLKPGDVVEAMDGQPVTSWKELVSLILEHEIGDTTVVRVKRGEETLELKAVLEARP